jgi:hypothetical protein
MEDSVMTASSSLRWMTSGSAFSKLIKEADADALSSEKAIADLQAQTDAAGLQGTPFELSLKMSRG